MVLRAVYLTIYPKIVVIIANRQLFTSEKDLEIQVPKTPPFLGWANTTLSAVWACSRLVRHAWVDTWGDSWPGF